MKPVVLWPNAPPRGCAHATPQHDRAEMSCLVYSMSCLRAASWQGHVVVDGTTPRWPAPRFECLNLGCGEGWVNRVLTYDKPRISARFSLQRILRVPAVPTNPLMPNLEQFARFGGREQQYKDFGTREYLPLTAFARLLPNGHALCACVTAAPCSCCRQRLVPGIVATLVDLTATPEAVLALNWALASALLWNSHPWKRCQNATYIMQSLVV